MAATVAVGLTLLSFFALDALAGVGTLLASSGLIAVGSATHRGRSWVVGGGVLTVAGLGLLIVGLAYVPSASKPAPSVAVSPGPTATAPAASSPSASSGPTLAQQKEQVRRAYLQFWDVVAQTSLSHDPAPLSNVAGGQVLDYATSALAHDRSVNQTWLIKQDHNIKSITVIQGLGGPGLGAQVDDFYVDHTVLVDPQTMHPIQPDPNRSGHQSYTLKEVAPAVWKAFFGSEVH